MTHIIAGSAIRRAATLSVAVLNTIPYRAESAAARLRMLNRGWREILPSEQIRELATQLLDQHSLRAADSLQLASSLIWCEQRPSRRNFICGDHRLAEAAESTGFSILELS
jgi:predicted nucleic acid-binding protein